MTAQHKTRRPSPAVLIACLALFVALGSGAYAAINLPKDSVKSKHIVNKQVKPKDLSKKYQEFCKPGAIKGSVVLSPVGLGTSFTEVPGFNCSGGAVQARKTEIIGEYRVRFVDNPGAASGVVSSGLQDSQISVARITDVTIGNELVFRVIAEGNDGAPQDGPFTLLAY